MMDIMKSVQDLPMDLKNLLLVDMIAINVEEMLGDVHENLLLRDLKEIVDPELSPFNPLEQKNFAALLNRLIIQSKCGSVSIGELLASVEPLPIETKDLNSAELEKQLSHRTSLSEAHNKLKDSLNNTLGSTFISVTMISCIYSHCSIIA